MKNKLFGLLTIAGSLLVSQSCYREIEEEVISDESMRFSLVEEELRPYFTRFEEEAAMLGFTVDISAKKIGGVIKDIDEDHVVGRCTHSKNVKQITIDKKFWERSSDLAREFVVFHELGHCYLSRPHLEDAFDNGICVSIMRSGKEDCLDNYNHSTRSYYMSELFFPGGDSPNIILANNN